MAGRSSSCSSSEDQRAKAGDGGECGRLCLHSADPTSTSPVAPAFTPLSYHREIEHIRSPEAPRTRGVSGVLGISLLSTSEHSLLTIRPDGCVFTVPSAHAGIRRRCTQNRSYGNVRTSARGSRGDRAHDCSASWAFVCQHAASHRECTNA